MLFQHKLLDTINNIEKCEYIFRKYIKNQKQHFLYGVSHVTFIRHSYYYIIDPFFSFDLIYSHVRGLQQTTNSI